MAPLEPWPYLPCCRLLPALLSAPHPHPRPGVPGLGLHIWFRSSLVKPDPKPFLSRIFYGFQDTKHSCFSNWSLCCFRTRAAASPTARYRAGPKGPLQRLPPAPGPLHACCSSAHPLPLPSRTVTMGPVTEASSEPHPPSREEAAPHRAAVPTPLSSAPGPSARPRPLTCELALLQEALEKGRV